MHSIEQIPTSRDSVLAFKVKGKIQSEDLEAMAKTMNRAFDAHDSVNMLMIFSPYDGSETGATLDWEVMKSNFRSLVKMDRYAVVGAPEGPDNLIDFMDHLIPVDAETFEPHEVEDAWDFVGASAR